MSQPTRFSQDVQVFKQRKEKTSSRLPIPSFFRRGHTKQAASQPLISYPTNNYSANFVFQPTRSNSVDLQPQSSQPKPSPSRPARKSFDFDLRPKRYKQPPSPSKPQSFENNSSSSTRFPRKSLGDSPTSPTVLLVERRNLKVRKPLPTFPETEEQESEESVDHYLSSQSIASSSTSNSTAATSQNEMVRPQLFPSFSPNNTSSNGAGSLNNSNGERLNRQRSVSQSSLTRKFSDEARRFLGGNKEKSRERNATMDGNNFGLDGKALKRSSKTKDFDLRSHFFNSPSSPTGTETSEESTLKDYESFSAMLKPSSTPSVRSSRPGSSGSTTSKSSIVSSAPSDGFSSPSSSPRKGRSTVELRGRTVSSPQPTLTAIPPPRCSSRSSSRKTAHGMSMTTSPIRTESGHGEDSISPSKASSTISPSPSGSSLTETKRPLLGSWLCEEEEEGETSLQIMLSTHRRSSSECSLDILDRRNLASSYALQHGDGNGNWERMPTSDVNTFVFPAPPKTLRERHSHSSLRSATKVKSIRRNHSGGDGPAPIFGLISISTSPINTKPSSQLSTSTSNSALRERRAKPPLMLSLPTSLIGSEVVNRGSKISGTPSPWSPPPCPPPSTPLPDLPPSSSNNKNSFKLGDHSRSSSGNASPSPSGILRHSTRPRSRTFSSSHQNSRPLFDLNGSFDLETALKLQEQREGGGIGKRVSFRKEIESLESFSNSRPPSITSSHRSKRDSSDWSSPITPGFSLDDSPASKPRNLDFLSSNFLGDEILTGQEEMEMLADEKPQLLCALGLENLIRRNSEYSLNGNKERLEVEDEFQGDLSLDDGVVYGFAI